jgi:uridine phosphorylase
MSVQHHLRIGPEHLEGNGKLGRFVLLPGDPARAERISSHFGALETVRNPRGLTVYIGTIDRGGEDPIEVLAAPTGIGTASVEVVVSELIACGARRLLRVGSCGSMVEEIVPGQVVIATGAVRDEQTSGHYAPAEYPAVADPHAVQALIRGARRAGLADETFLGICHSKASLYGREFGRGPAREDNLAYTSWLRRCGVIASEMEASALFVLASTATPAAETVSRRRDTICRAGAVLAVFGTDDSQMNFDATAADLAEERAIRVALAGIAAWAERDHLDVE